MPAEFHVSEVSDRMASISDIKCVQCERVFRDCRDLTNHLTAVHATAAAMGRSLSAAAAEVAGGNSRTEVKLGILNIPLKRRREGSGGHERRFMLRDGDQELSVNCQVRHL